MAVGVQPWFYPRRFTRIADIIASTPQTVFEAGTRVRISHIVIANASAGTNTVLLRAVDDSPIVVTVTLLAGVTIVIPGWQTDIEGIEALSATAGDATGVHATFFHGPGSLGVQ